MLKRLLKPMAMMPRPLKALYSVLMRLPMRFNGPLYQTYRQPEASV